MPSVSLPAVVVVAVVVVSSVTSVGGYRFASRTLRTSSTVPRSARNGIRSVNSVSCLRGESEKESAQFDSVRV
jgi:hypothetical protein